MKNVADRKFRIAFGDLGVNLRLSTISFCVQPASNSAMNVTESAAVPRSMMQSTLNHHITLLKCPRPNKKTHRLMRSMRIVPNLGQTPHKAQYPIRTTTEFGININGDAPIHPNHGRLKSFPQLSFGMSMMAERMSRPNRAAR